MSRPPITDSPLLDRLRRYHIPDLATDSGVSQATLYSFAAGTHRRTPWRVIKAIAPLLRARPETLAREWAAVRTDSTATRDT